MSQSSYYDALIDDEGGILCYLVNVKIWSNKLTCGIGRFRGGISGKLQLYDVNGLPIAKIILPPQVRESQTSLVLGSKNDDLAIDLATS
jgi:hypothetical protein